MICPTCARPSWSGGEVKSVVAECVAQGDDVCKLVESRNSLAAALRSLLLSSDVQTRRTARAIAEQYVAMNDYCPVCASVIPGGSGTIRVHFASGIERRPCPASFKTMEEARKL